MTGREEGSKMKATENETPSHSNHGEIPTSVTWKLGKSVESIEEEEENCGHPPENNNNDGGDSQHLQRTSSNFVRSDHPTFANACKSIKFAISIIFSYFIIDHWPFAMQYNANAICQQLWRFVMTL